MGLAVDAALEVLSVDVGHLDDPPSLATQAGYDMTRAVVRRTGAEPILVLSLEHVLESVYRSALSAREFCCFSAVPDLPQRWRRSRGSARRSSSCTVLS